jgi:beta-mannanase
MQWMTSILDAKCKKADLDKIATSANHLTNSEQKSLLNLLKKHEDSFDGTFGTFTGTLCNVEVKDDAESHVPDLSQFQKFMS